MRRFVLLAFITALLAGCSGEKDRNVNRDRDRPRSGEPEKVQKDKTP